MGVTLVGGSQTGLLQAGSGSNTLSASVDPTAGNALIVQCLSFDSSAATSPVLSKSSGTATIGTIATSQATTNDIPGLGAGLAKITTYAIPVTGSGTFVLGFTSSNTIIAISFGEYAGMDAIPVVDTSVQNVGTSVSSYTSGAVSNSVAGAVISAWMDDHGSAYTYGTFSGTELWEQTNTSSLTGVAEVSFPSGAGPTTNTLTASQTANYITASVAYKAAGASGNVTVNPTGLGLTASRGTPTVVLINNPTVTPTGLSLTASHGTPTVTTNGNTLVQPSGFGLTIGLGTFAVEGDVTMLVTGFNVSTALGQFTIQANDTLTGMAGFGLPTFLGTPVVSITSGVTVHPTGLGLTASVGTPVVVLIASPTITPIGFGLTINRGTPSINVSGSVTVSPTGFALAADLGVQTIVVTSTFQPTGFALHISLGVPTVRTATPIQAPPSPTILVVQMGNTETLYIADNGGVMPEPTSFTAGTTGPYVMRCIGANGQPEPLSGATVTLVVQSINGGIPVVDHRPLTILSAATGTVEWDRMSDETVEAGDYLMQLKVVRSDGTVGRYPDGSDGALLTILPALGGLG